MKYKTILVCLMFIFLTGCYHNSSESERSSTKSISPQKNMTKSSQPTKKENSYNYDVSNIIVGTSIGKFKIKDFSSYSDHELEKSEDMKFSIIFEGEFESEGDLWFEDVLLENYYFGNDSKTSEYLPFSTLESEIEASKNEKMTLGFYIENENDLINEVKILRKNFKKGDEIKIKAVFKDYRFDLYEYEYEHWAKFVKLIQISN